MHMNILMYFLPNDTCKLDSIQAVFIYSLLALTILFCFIIKCSTLFEAWFLVEKSTFPYLMFSNRVSQLATQSDSCLFQPFIPCGDCCPFSSNSFSWWARPKTEREWCCPFGECNASEEVESTEALFSCWSLCAPFLLSVLWFFIFGKKAGQRMECTR